MRRVLLFGAFDPLHPGHINFFQQAKQLGEQVLVVVARDSTISKVKKRTPFQSETARVEALRNCGFVDEVYLGHEGADRYQILDELIFDMIALGYDQEPSEDILSAELARRDKKDIEVVRLKPFQPDKYKSTFFRPKDSE